LSKPELKETEQILTSKYPKPKKGTKATQIIDEDANSNSSVGSFAKKYGINSEYRIECNQDKYSVKILAFLGMKLSLQDKTTVNTLGIQDELKTFYSKLSGNKNVSH
jgi:hypothetical protein